MTDDLIEPSNAEQSQWPQATELYVRGLEWRIEALTEQLESARLDAKEAEAYSVWLESKLQKTVTALQKVRDFVRDLEPYADQGHTLAPALYDACVILNELEGHKHD